MSNDNDFYEREEWELNKKIADLVLKNDIKDSVIYTMSAIFFALYYIDMRNDTFLEIKPFEPVRERFGKEGCASEALTFAINTAVSGAYRSRLHAGVEYNSIRRVLRDRDGHSIEFLSTVTGWARCMLFSIERDGNGEAQTVLFGFRNINQAKEKENRMMADLRMTREAANTIYPLQASLNLSTGQYHFVTLDIPDAASYERDGIIDDLIEQIVGGIPEEKEKDDFRGLFNRRSILNAISNGAKEIHLRHRRLEKDGVIHWVDTRCIYVSDMGPDIYAIMLSHLIDREVEQMEKRNEQLGIINGLSNEYISLWLVDLETMSMQLLSSNEAADTNKDAINFGLQSSNYLETRSWYIESQVAPEDKERVREATKTENVLENIKDSKIYTITYKRIVYGKENYNQIIYLAAGTARDGFRNFVIGFRNADEAVREKLENEKLLKAALESAERANNSKSMFLFNMSHDIRTPMNAILGLSNLAEKHINEPEVLRGYLKNIQLSGERLLAIINQVLEMARIENGVYRLEELPENIVELFVADMVMFKGDISKKNQKFITSVEVKHPYIYCDSSHLSEIMLNLVSNAIKYTGEGGTIECSIRQLPSEREGYCIIESVVKDNGVGMSEEFQQHLFEAFAREKSVTDSGIQGTGLGMGIVKKLVELMGGTIGVSSRPGVGTTFTVDIPFRLAEPPANEKGGDSGDMPDTAVFAGKRILMAEDNDMNAEIAIEILQEIGFVVERAVDGVECVDKLEKADSGYYDLILMDIQMPNMDGYKATQIIRGLADERKASIPISAMTANAFEEDRRNALASGMNGHIAKPIELSKMIETLKQLLK